MAESGMNWLRQLYGSSKAETIRGGLALPRNKPGLSEPPYIVELDEPSVLIIPLLDYRRATCMPLVEVGDAVNLGDQLAAGIIASARGVVTAIEKRVVIHPSQGKELCVVLATEPCSSDSDSDNSNSNSNSNSNNNSNSNSNNSNSSNSSNSSNYIPVERRAAHPPLKELTIERMEVCGIHGLGGAGFNTAEKFQAGFDSRKGIDTLIINAVECEPMISCDEALMMTSAVDIICAIQNLIHMTRCHRCILAIEDDKSQALAAIMRAIDDSVKMDLATDPAQHPAPQTSTGQTSSTIMPPIELRLLSPVYPSGAERPLVERLTDTRLSGTTKPIEHGIICINVATALATWKAQQGYVPVSRVVTIAGERAQNPVNVRARFGTSIAEVLRMSGNADFSANTRIRVGGPLSGFDVTDLSAPITATTNCIAVEAPVDAAVASPCIRCGACSDVCPVDLLPQQLYWYASGDDIKNSRRFGLESCIECGCCDVVCPSSIALTQTFRYAQGVLREQSRQAQLATAAEQRFQYREQRQTARLSLREERRTAARTRLQTTSNDPISDALKRAQRRKQSIKKKSASHKTKNQLDGDSA